MQEDEGVEETKERRKRRRGKRNKKEGRGGGIPRTAAAAKFDEGLPCHRRVANVLRRLCLPVCSREESHSEAARRPAAEATDKCDCNPGGIRNDFHKFGVIITHIVIIISIVIISLF